mgnify:CR=1 FL=1
MFILGVQHMFAMFGATVLVPLLTGLSVSTTLLCAGLGTCCSTSLPKEGACIPRLLLCVSGRLLHRGPHAGRCRRQPDRCQHQDAALRLRRRRIFRSGVSGGQPADLHLRHPPHHAVLPAGGHGPHHHLHRPDPCPSAITNCQSNWLLAFVALAAVIVCNIWGKGMVKILPILIGVLVSYAVAW